MSDPLAAFFERFQAAFEEAAAARNREENEKRLHAGDTRFRFRFATAEIEEALMPALEHLCGNDSNGDMDFEVAVWESVGSGVQPPRPPWKWGDSAPKGELAELSGPRFFGHLNHDSGAISLFDLETRRAIFWMADIKALRGYERAAPFLPIFQWSFQLVGKQVTHAAAAGIASGAALFAGKGGSGKSTTAALARKAGLLHMGDDYCLLSTDPPRVYPFYRSAKLHPRSLELAPLQGSREQTAWVSDDKSVLLLDGGNSGALPLKAILLPHVTSLAETAIRPAGGAEALRALAPSSLFQLSGTSAATFRFFAALSKQIPAFHLDLGADAHNVGRRIEELLEGLP